MYNNQSAENQLKVQGQKCPTGISSNLFAYFQASDNFSNILLLLPHDFFLFCMRIPSHTVERE